MTIRKGHVFSLRLPRWVVGLSWSLHDWHIGFSIFPVSWNPWCVWFGPLAFTIVRRYAPTIRPGEVQ